MDSRSISELNFGTHYKIDCLRNGEVVWTESINNMVVNTGLGYAMSRIFTDVEREDLCMGLCTEADSLPTDTADLHLFVEFLGTTNMYRPVAEFSDGGIQPDNKYNYVAADVQAMITADATLKGIFLTTGKVKGEDTGTLYGVAQFSAPKSVVVGDALLVTITASAKG